MQGSNVKNIKLDPNKQKLVECTKCKLPLVIGKFAKNEQTCATANYFPTNCPEKKGNVSPIKPKSAREKIAAVQQTDTPAPKATSDKPNGKNHSPAAEFAASFTKLMDQLGFEIDNQRRYKKRYAIDSGGGVMTIYPHIAHGVTGENPRIEYFSMILQRAISVDEEFRKIMPPDAATDCELLSAELGEQTALKPEVGYSKCDGCGITTDEFGVDIKNNKVLCIKPNNCFKRGFTTRGAEAEA